MNQTRLTRAMAIGARDGDGGGRRPRKRREDGASERVSDRPMLFYIGGVTSTRRRGATSNASARHTPTDAHDDAHDDARRLSSLVRAARCIDRDRASRARTRRANAIEAKDGVGESS